MDSLIRWRKDDYKKLRNAINKFNRTIDKLEDDTINYLPDVVSYKEIKSSINTRKELNRTIKMLRSASYENLSDFITLDSGEILSKWEYRQLRLAKNRALRHLERERETILSERPSIGMGDERLSEIQAIEKSFSNFTSKKGSDFNRVKARIFSIGKSDYKIGKDLLFMKNFYTALEGISNFQNYDKLKAELDKIKNPSKFYEFVKSSPVLMDLFLWYKESDSLFYGGFSNNQEAFDSTLMYHLGITDID